MDHREVAEVLVVAEIGDVSADLQLLVTALYEPVIGAEIHLEEVVGLGVFAVQLVIGAVHIGPHQAVVVIEFGPAAGARDAAPGPLLGAGVLGPGIEWTIGRTAGRARGGTTV